MLKPSFEIVAVYAIVLTLLFFLFIGDAAQFEEGNQTTHSGQVKHEIIRAITFTGRLIGDSLLKNSMLFSGILIPFSIAIDAYLLGVITKFIQIIFKRISKNIFAAK